MFLDCEPDYTKNELRYLVLELKFQETVYISWLKQLTPPEQWPAVFEDFLADAKRPADQMALYHFERMLDELFTELCQHLSFVSFQYYEEAFRV